jgi:hypothetical protein
MSVGGGVFSFFFSGDEGINDILGKDGLLGEDVQERGGIDAIREIFLEAIEARIIGVFFTEAKARDWKRAKFFDECFCDGVVVIVALSDGVVKEGASFIAEVTEGVEERDAFLFVEVCGVVGFLYEGLKEGAGL